MENNTKEQGTSEYSKMVKWEQRLERESPLFRELLNSIKNEPIRVLDIGCGTGEHLRLFAKWRNIIGVGIDTNEENLNIARKRTKLHHLDNLEENITFKNSDMRDLDKVFPEDEFDFVMCIGNSLATFNEDERNKILQNILHVTKSGGIIFLQVVNYHVHDKETEWFYSPSLKRDEENKLIFYLRMMEWPDDNKEEVTMYVQKLTQDEVKSEKFNLETKKTSFVALMKNDFNIFQTKGASAVFYGDYFKSNFNIKESNDIIAIIEKRH